MGKGTGDTAVSHLQTILHPVLIGSGNGHDLLQIIDIVATEDFIFNHRSVSCNDRILPFLIQNRQTVFLFMLVDHFRSGHPLQKQLCHLCIHFIDDASGLLQFVCHVD